MKNTSPLSNEDKGRFLLELYRNAQVLEEKELYDYFLDHAVELTQSRIGFFHFVTADQKTIILTTWNKEALKNCTADYDSHYPIEKAGNWADCVRLKHPIIYNDFASSPNQKGLPEGHVIIKRIISVPIMENDKAQIIFGVGNKPFPYTEEDTIQLELVANEFYKIMKQRGAEKELRESQEKYYSLFANMTEGFFLGKILVDDEGNPIDFIFLEVNNGFEKQSGLRRSDVVGKTVRQILPAIEQSWIQTYGKVASTGQPIRFENYNKDTKKWYEVYSYCPARGEFASMFTDITERKKAGEALEQARARLQKYNEDLERLVEERTIELQNKERMAAIGAVAGMVGHDIRNPLQAIAGDLYLAKEDVVLLPDSEEKRNILESLAGIEQSVEYVNKIVQDLQDYNRKLNPVVQLVDLKDLCEQLLLSGRVPENVEASLRIGEEVRMVQTDFTMLKRVLNNLVNNAIQAMPEGGRLEVQAYLKDDSCIVEVKDSGVGIPEWVKPKLFTPLFTTRSKGQGFGLAVAKRLVEALGGTIYFESEVGKGTKFVSAFPMSK